MLVFSFTSSIDNNNTDSYKSIKNIKSTVTYEFCVEINYYTPEKATESIQHYLKSNNLILIKTLYRYYNKAGIKVRKRIHGTENATTLDEDLDIPNTEVAISFSYYVKNIECSNDDGNFDYVPSIFGI
ncbi:hypothetical protein ACSIGC_05660 [Tenacibaculum sp. ZS6-P6]|uniref:hypothetical protein n=1 Tax=Tenacibaculum sp. ZS6-P6 TaxID=3447503 RepID=UPI003F94C970